MHDGNQRVRPRVMVQGITDPHDKDLNGRVGSMAPFPFPSFLTGFHEAAVGVRLDPDRTRPHWFWPDKKDEETGLYMIGCPEESVVLKRDEYRVIEPGNSI